MGGDLKARWIESHYGPAAAVFSNRLVKAFFAGKQGIEWKDSARIETICSKEGVKYDKATKAWGAISKRCERIR